MYYRYNGWTGLSCYEKVAALIDESLVAPTCIVLMTALPLDEG